MGLIILFFKVPYKFNVRGKFLRAVQKPSFCQVGMPYIMSGKILILKFD